MTFTQYLKVQLTDFVDTYKKYYLKTNGTTIIFTLITFLFIALLFHFSIFDETNAKKTISLLSYFFVRYSVADTYSIVDLSKTVFIFFVSIFSISLVKLERNKTAINDFNFSHFLKNISGKALGYLLAAMLICIVADYFLFRLDSLSIKNYGGSPSTKWLHGMLFMLRVYIPLIIFSITNYIVLTGHAGKLNFKNMLYLFTSLWMFNEFAYECSLFVRGHIFDLILLPFSEDNHYLIESFLGVVLVAFYFLGYHVAMTHSIILLNTEEQTPASQIS
ncbi:hypothetical protein F0919_16775 [Taibaiella lutea]|uniref:Beta-carotene 15,15'-monooxygenase n=1 Tax=Taibaiella lutea TaxID=2608001 RepID=A0A5M6CEW0_9BACT|nr:hypothetical protein [Taibaiella lutea]KAA5532442.1 hypothetical protein F0919_16775 [Taibaiella lutea]